MGLCPRASVAASAQLLCQRARRAGDQLLERGTPRPWACLAPLGLAPRIGPPALVICTLLLSRYDLAENSAAVRSVVAMYTPPKPPVRSKSYEFHADASMCFSRPINPPLPHAATRGCPAATSIDLAKNCCCDCLLLPIAIPPLPIPPISSIAS